MKRRQRSEILARSPEGFAQGLAQVVSQKYPVSLIQTPQPVLVMVKQRESGRNSLFYLGEVLLTEAKVTVAGSIGLGFIQDDDEDRAERRALDLAIIDAAYNAQLPECAAWDEMLQAQSILIDQALALEQGRIRQSAVSFQTMDK